MREAENNARNLFCHSEPAKNRFPECDNEHARNNRIRKWSCRVLYKTVCEFGCRSLPIVFLLERGSSLRSE